MNKILKFRIIAAVIIFSSLSFIADFKYQISQETDYLVTIKTEFGDMKLLLFDDTPIHKKNFITLAGEGKYNGSIFHRVINNFMIQGGGLSKEFQNYFDTLSFDQKTLPNEINGKHLHKFGALAAARTDNPEKRSDISQFYIVQNHDGAHHLDNNYTVFGQLIIGFDVIDEIAHQNVDGSTPTKPITMNISIQKVKRSDVIKFYGNVY